MSRFEVAFYEGLKKGVKILPSPCGVTQGTKTINDRRFGKFPGP